VRSGLIIAINLHFECAGINILKLITIPAVDLVECLNILKAKRLSEVATEEPRLPVLIHDSDGCSVKLNDCHVGCLLWWHGAPYVAWRGLIRLGGLGVLCRVAHHGQIGPHELSGPGRMPGVAHPGAQTNQTARLLRTEKPRNEGAVSDALCLAGSQSRHAFL